MTTSAVTTDVFPSPTGRFPVGRTTLEFVDPDRGEIYSSDPTDRRELGLWTWYPAERLPAAPFGEYLPGAWAASGMAPDAAWFEAERAITFDGWRIVDGHAQPGCTIQIAGAKHMSFMDVPFLPTTSDAPVKAMLAATTIDPQRMWRVTTDLLLAFFAAYLDGVPSTVLTGPSPSYPEIFFGAP